jgi:hypothetical protein
MTPSDFFEVFVAEQLLKQYDLSDEQINSGLVGGGDDGGLDGFYTFIDGQLIVEDSDLSVFKKGARVEIVIFQSKSEAKFSETAVQKIQSTLSHLLDLSCDVKKISSLYNADIQRVATIYRNVIQTLAGVFPKRTISIFYASEGVKAHSKVELRAKELEEMVRDLFGESGCTCTVEMVTAGRLNQLAQETKRASRLLTLTEKLESNSGGIVGLVKLTEYFRFISDENKKLQRHLFESNVRDYEGKGKGVNKEIRECLHEHWPVEFWWLNNGITIVAEKVQPTKLLMEIQDPQIVNGLQTSMEIHRYFETGNTENEDREILVRIITPKDAAERDRVIKATNSQTSIAAASLRATDEIQRHIEQFLKPFGWFYERRKNYYKNESKPRSKIISIQGMAQSLIAIVLQEPDSARARPSNLIKEDSEYKVLFNKKHPLPLFRAVVELMKLAEATLADDSELTKDDRVNLRFYVAMYLAATVCGLAKPDTQRIATLAGQKIDAVLVKQCHGEVKEAYKKLGGDANVAKGIKLRQELIWALEKKLGKKKPQKAA